MMKLEIMLKDDLWLNKLNTEKSTQWVEFRFDTSIVRLLLAELCSTWILDLKDTPMKNIYGNLEGAIKPLCERGEVFREEYGFDVVNSTLALVYSIKDACVMYAESQITVVHVDSVELAIRKHCYVNPETKQEMHARLARELEESEEDHD